MLYRRTCSGTERVELDKVGCLPLLPKGIQVLYGLCSTSHSRQQDNHTSIAKTPKGVADISKLGKFRFDHVAPMSLSQPFDDLTTARSHM